MKQQRVRRLALSYLAVIMTLSLSFSVIIYAITSVQLDRPLPPGKHAQQPPELVERQFNRRLEQRNRETRGSVIMSLAALNGVMLLLAIGSVCYWHVGRSSQLSGRLSSKRSLCRMLAMSYEHRWRRCCL